VVLLSTSIIADHRSYSFEELLGREKMEIKQFYSAIKLIQDEIFRELPMQHLAILLLVALNKGITQPEIQRTLNMPQGTCSRNCSRLSVHVVKRKGDWTDVGYGLLSLKETHDSSGAIACYLSDKGKKFVKKLEDVLKVKK